jgi:hypothetical protein
VPVSAQGVPPSPSDSGSRASEKEKQSPAGIQKKADAIPAKCSTPPYGAKRSNYRNYAATIERLPTTPSLHAIDWDFRNACIAKFGTPAEQRQEAQILAHMETVGGNPMSATAAGFLIRTSTIYGLQAIYQMAEDRKRQPHIHYQPMTFRNFIVDGRRLAAKMALVQIKGVYVQVGQIRLIFRNPSDAAVFSYGPANMSEMFIPIESGTSSHGAREAFYDCGEHGGRCEMTFWGIADMCTMTRNGIAQSPQPCLAVSEARLGY